MSYPVTLCTIFFCVVFYLIMMGMSRRGRYDDLFNAYALIPYQVKRGQFYRLVTAGFLHLSPVHILMNMIALYNLGSFLEPLLGSIRFVIVLVLSIIGGNLLVTYQGNPQTRTVGISGGLYGLMMVYFVLLFRLGLLQNPSVYSSVIRTIVLNVMISFTPGVSLQGHAGGACVGIVLGFLYFYVL